MARVRILVSPDRLADAIGEVLGTVPPTEAPGRASVVARGNHLIGAALHGQRE